MEIEIRLWYYTVQYIQCCMRWEDESFEKEKKKKKNMPSPLYFFIRDGRSPFIPPTSLVYVNR